MTMLPVNERRLTRRQIALYALAGGTTAYCVYKLYHSERLRAIQRRCSTTWTSVGQLLRLLDTLAELSVPANVALRDVMTRHPQTTALDSVLQAASSQRGQTVLSLAISVGARSLVDAVADQWRANATPTAPRPPAEWLDAFFTALSTPNGMHVMSVALSVLTTRAVDTWVRASEEVDVWDELLRAMSRPAHRRVVHEMTEIFTRTAATTLVESLTRPPTLARCVSIQVVPMMLFNTSHPYSTRSPCPPLRVVGAPHRQAWGDSSNDGAVSDSGDSEPASDPAGTPPVGQPVGALRIMQRVATDADHRALLSGVTYSAIKGGVEGSLAVVQRWQSVHVLAVVVLALALLLMSKLFMAVVNTVVLPR